MFIVYDDGHVNVVCLDSTWIIDTTSFHIIPCRDFFSFYTSDNFGWVRMRNQAKCQIVGIGDVQLETRIWCKLLLKDVKHVPNMRFNLISIGKLDDKGYHNQLVGRK